MLFNSLQFLVFFPIVTMLYYLTPFRWRWLLLLLASCAFYMALIPAYILILLAIILIDYSAAFYIERSFGPKRKFYLAISIFLNVGVLAFFKYFHVFTRVVDLLSQHHLIHGAPMAYLNIILPLGLSFHTFQSMSYTIEVYRGHQKAERHFGFYALYVMFYPQLVAGPIERPQNLLTQLHQDKPFDYQNLWQGLRLMLWGLFKKLVIADRLSGYVNPIFNHPSSYHNLQLLVGAVAFTFQIYCDFSGYSDIALGAAKCIGFDLIINFKRPLLYSTNIAEFWRRWHISLYSWFSDYVYMPLVILFRDYGKVGLGMAIVITFVLSGMWHGSNRTFLVFGLIHAFYMLFYFSLSRRSKKFNNTFWNKLAAVITFLAVTLAFIFFRAESLSTAWFILSRIFSPDRYFYVFNKMEYFKPFSMGISIVMCLYMMMVESVTDPLLKRFNGGPKVDLLFCAVTLSFILCLGIFKQQTFIYFQF